MFLPILLIFFLDTRNILGNGENQVETSYEELRQLNGSCFPGDSCERYRPDTNIGVTGGYACSCHINCSTLGTCCIDAPYRNSSSPNPKPSCRTIEEYSYFMTDRCPNDGGLDSIWKTLCEEEWNEEDDLLKLVPVTSLQSSTTYKNYYCFRCHETTDEFIYWNVNLRSNYSNSIAELDNEDVRVTYDRRKKKWMAVIEKEGLCFPVELKYAIPREYSRLLISCNSRVISSCSEVWTDRATRDKCHAYTALVSMVRRYNVKRAYKNPHCALCNFESMDKLSCFVDSHVVLRPKVTSSFTYLIDNNLADRDQVENNNCGENFLWDRFGKKCRRIKCRLPGYIIKGNKCAPQYLQCPWSHVGFIGNFPHRHMG